MVLCMLFWYLWYNLSFKNLTVYISDEIIKLNKKKPGTGPGSVISRGTQQSRGRRGDKGKRNDQSNTGSGSLQGRLKGRGGMFNQVRAFSTVFSNWFSIAYDTVVWCSNELKLMQ
jgi:hypothetical protein